MAQVHDGGLEEDAVLQAALKLLAKPKRPYHSPSYWREDDEQRLDLSRGDEEAPASSHLGDAGVDVHQLDVSLGDDAADVRKFKGECKEKVVDRMLSRLGHTSWREGQRDSVLMLLRKRDVCAWLSTGTGKTLIPLVHTLVVGGITVVVTPIIVLMRAQIRSIEEGPSGLRAVFLGSHSDCHQQKRAESGDVDLIFISPEYAFTWISNNPDVASQVTLLVIDEAHCVVEDGTSRFRPEMVDTVPKIRGFLLPEGTPMQNLSATMSPAAAELYQRLMCLRNVHTERGNPDRPNVYIAIRESTELVTDIRRMADEFAHAKAAAHGKCHGIGYFTTKKELLAASEIWRAYSSKFLYGVVLREKEPGVFEVKYDDGDILLSAASHLKKSTKKRP